MGDPEEDFTDEAIQELVRQKNEVELDLKRALMALHRIKNMQILPLVTAPLMRKVAERAIGQGVGRQFRPISAHRWSQTYGSKSRPNE